MARVPKLLIAVAAQLALSGAALPDPHLYLCTAVETLPDGEVRAERAVDNKGVTIELTGEWQTMSGAYPRFGGRWWGEALDHAMLQINVGSIDRSRPMRTVFSECGPNFDTCSGGYRYKTEFFPDPGMGTVANWDVVLAISRQWGTLYLLIEDDRGKILLHHQIDVARLKEIDTTVHRLAAKTTEMARDREHACEVFEPIVSPSVRITPPSAPKPAH